MKYFRRCILFFVILFSFNVCNAGSVYSNLDEFVDGVRNTLKISSTSSIISEAALYQFCKEAILWTSVDIGGYEVTYRFITAADQSWYAIPDTVTEVLFATLQTVDGKLTKDLRAFHTEYVEEKFNLNTLYTDDGEAPDNDATPKAYNVWADSIQLIPTPVKADSVILKCYMEHPMPNISDSLIHLKSAYVEAAMQFACGKVKEHVGLDAEGAKYFQKFGSIKADLLRKYESKFGMRFNQGATQ